MKFYRVVLEKHQAPHYELGGVQFERGVSVDAVPERTAVMLRALVPANIYPCDVSGKPFDDAHATEINKRGLPVPAPETLPEFDDAELVGSEEQSAGFTREELEAIADIQGIDGLREIGNELGVKSNSIVGLIDAIVKAQGGSAE